MELVYMPSYPAFSLHSYHRRPSRHHPLPWTPQPLTPTMVTRNISAIHRRNLIVDRGLQTNHPYAPAFWRLCGLALRRPLDSFPPSDPCLLRKSARKLAVSTTLSCTHMTHMLPRTLTWRVFPPLHIYNKSYFQYNRLNQNSSKSTYLILIH